MKKGFINHSILTLAPIVLFFSTSQCSHKVIISFKEPVIFTVPVSSFNRISLQDSWNVILTQGEMIPVSVECDENLKSKISITVENETLCVKSVGVATRNPKYQNIYVQVPDLIGIYGLKGSDVRFKTPFKGDSLICQLEQGSDIDISYTGNRLIISAVSGSDIQLFCTVKELFIRADQGSDIHGLFDNTKSVTLHLNRGSDAEIYGEISFLLLRSGESSDVTANKLFVRDADIELINSDASLHVTRSLSLSLKSHSHCYLSGDPDIKSLTVGEHCDLIKMD